MIFQTGRRVTTPGCGGHMDGECCPPGSAAPLRGRRFGKVSRDSTPPIITFGTVKLPRRLTNFEMARGVRMIFQTGRRVTTPGCGGHMDGECCPPGSAAPLRGRRFGKVSRDSTPPIITFGTVKLPRRLTNFVMAHGGADDLPSVQRFDEKSRTTA